jgi:hypothetical protein
MTAKSDWWRPLLDPTHFASSRRVWMPARVMSLGASAVFISQKGAVNDDVTILVLD